MAYAFGDEAIKLWTPDYTKDGWGLPDEVENFKGQIRARNAAFERLIFWHVLGVDFKLEQFYCTATESRANCAPGSLADAARFAGASMKKDYRGAQLIRQLSIPAPDGSFCYDPILLKEMYDYCVQDVAADRATSKCMRQLSDEELYDYHVNERVNDRGITIDLPLAQAATKYAKEELREVQGILVEVTGGEVISARSPKLKSWVMQRVGTEAIKLMTVYKDGAKKFSLDKEIRENILDLADVNPEEVPNEVADAIQCASDLSASSVAKFNRMEQLSDVEDNRVRGAFVFNGASATGRAASFGIQFQNMARNTAKDPVAVRDAMVHGHDLAPIYGSCVTEVLKGMIRPALIPAEGNIFVVADWSSIEGRVNPWMAQSEYGEQKLDLYRRGLDPYIVNASHLYQSPYEDISKAQRQAGKVMELACFDRETRILTNTGIKFITEVLITDKLWDGEEWVKHQGLIFRGIRPTIRVLGVRVTGDHQVLAQEKWYEVKMALSNENIRYQMSETGLESLLCLVLNVLKAELATTILSAFNVPVEQNPTAFLFLISLKEHLQDVAFAQEKKLDFGEKTIMVTQILYLMNLIEEGCLTEYPPAFNDVKTQSPHTTITMAREELEYTQNGSKTKKLFFNTLLRLKDGINRSLNLIDTIITKDMLRGIYALQPDKKTLKTSETSTTYNYESTSLRPVYDILNVGRRNRFTILSDEGALVVHNCSYGGTINSFDHFAKVYRINLSTSEMSAAVQTWRKNNPWMLQRGGSLERTAKIAMRQPNKEIQSDRVTYLFDGRHLWYKLPSGRILAYPFAKMEGRDITYARSSLKPKANANEWPRGRLWFGELLNNTTQAPSNCLLRYALRELDKTGRSAVAHIHDEIICECKEEDVDVVIADMTRVMTTPPGWAKGLPLEIDIKTMKTYSK